MIVFVKRRIQDIPDGEKANLKVGGATCYFSHFWRKLYEIEKDQTERGAQP